MFLDTTKKIFQKKGKIEIFDSFKKELEENKFKITDFYSFVSKNEKYKDHLEEFKNLESFRKTLNSISSIYYLSEDKDVFAKKYVALINYKNINPNIV